MENLIGNLDIKLVKESSANYSYLTVNDKNEVIEYSEMIRDNLEKSNNERKI